MGTLASFFEATHKSCVIESCPIAGHCRVLAAVQMPRHSSILMLHFNLLFEFLTFALSFNSTSNFKYAPVGRLVPISHRATVTRCAPIRSASSCCVSSKSFLNPRICFGDMSFLYQLLQTMSRIFGVETDVLRFFWFCSFSCPVVVLITVGNGFIFVMVKSTKAVRCFKDVQL
jgi:hypothetical protein